MKSVEDEIYLKIIQVTNSLEGAGFRVSLRLGRLQNGHRFKKALEWFNEFVGREETAAPRRCRGGGCKETTRLRNANFRIKINKVAKGTA